MMTLILVIGDQIRRKEYERYYERSSQKYV